jgi:hypothetical protein
MKTPLVVLELLHSSRHTHSLRGHFAVNAPNTLRLNVIGDKYLISHKINNVYFLNEYLSYCKKYVNPLKTKLRLLYLQTQFVPRCKHFSSRQKNPVSL